ncbi:MAG TPA: efflux RND transporter periplasmic adaptor subunit [Polyangiaceae bacterium]|nr:efflux RND transporter periplasmic adaptor subunit [Polyangiaceae bacterium]
MTAYTEQPAIIGPERQLPAHGGGRSRPFWIMVGSLLTVAVVGAFVALVRAWRGTHKIAPPAPRVALTTATVREGDIAVHLDAIGTVTPVYTAQIASQVTGLVVAVHYREGQRVETGDPLVDIDARPYRATLLQAQGALERDENVLAQSRMDLQRYRDAWARDAIAKQTLDDQEKVVLQNIGTVKNDRGTVQYDQVQVDFCHITSPITGRVGLRLVDPGNLVQSTASVVLAVVTQIEPITVVFTVSEDHLGSIRKSPNLDVEAYDRAAQRKIAKGKLLAIDNVIDTTTGTVKARAIFDNKDDTLFPNQFVTVRVLIETRRGVTLLPASAVQQNGAESFVYVIQDDVAHVRKVKARVTDDGITEVEGVDPGQVVADSGFDRLHEGARIVLSTAPASAPSTRTSTEPAPPGSGSAAP